MSIFEQMEKDLGLVMDAPHGDSVAIVVKDEEETLFSPFRGKFDAAYVAVNAGGVADVSSAAPTAFLQESVVFSALQRDLKRSDRLLIGKKEYKPDEFMPDGLGLLTLKLLEV